MEGKICKKCKELKEYQYFLKDSKMLDGYKSNCKQCTNEYRKKYRESHPEQVEKAKTRSNNWYYQDDNKIRRRETNSAWRADNKEKLTIYYRERVRNKRKSDPLFKLKDNIRHLINQSIQNKGFSKNQKTEEILGCNFDEFKCYIESKFEPWMNWNNYGNWNGPPTEINTAWDIDHITPLDSANDFEQTIKLNHYLNLQPLCSYTNRNIKKNKI